MSRFRLSAAAAKVISGLGLALILASYLALLLNPKALAPSLGNIRRHEAEPFRTVILDPGHGGQDSGAVVGTVAEKNLTLDLAQRMARLLATQGLKSILTRSDDSYVSLADRAARANRVNDAIFVSIHLNDGTHSTASGVETYFAPRQLAVDSRLVSWFLPGLLEEKPRIESQSLAGFLQEELVSQTHASNRGTKAEQFYVLVNVRHPAVLVEAGFLTNKEEIGRLLDSPYREQLALALSNGIGKYRQTCKQRGPVLAQFAHE